MAVGLVKCARSGVESHARDTQVEVQGLRMPAGSFWGILVVGCVCVRTSLRAGGGGGWSWIPCSLRAAHCACAGGHLAALLPLAFECGHISKFVVPKPEWL